MGSGYTWHALPDHERDESTFREPVVVQDRVPPKKVACALDNLLFAIDPEGRRQTAHLP